MTVSVKNTEGYQHEYNTTERDSKSMHLPTTEHKTNVTTSSTCGTDSTQLTTEANVQQHTESCQQNIHTQIIATIEERGKTLVILLRICGQVQHITSTWSKDVVKGNPHYDPS